MKIIEAMKLTKDLMRKAEDLRKKVGLNCAHHDIDKPEYDNPDATIKGWIQAHSDIVREIEKLRLAIQQTNLATSVTIEMGGKQITKSIAAWIHRRRDLAKYDAEMWGKLTDRGLEPGFRRSSVGDAEPIPVQVVRHFNPAERDKMKEYYRAEPSLIDGTLEVVNATTELV